jgi:hypothetical protein
MGFPLTGYKKSPVNIPGFQKLVVVDAERVLALTRRAEEAERSSCRIVRGSREYSFIYRTFYDRINTTQDAVTICIQVQYM